MTDLELKVETLERSAALVELDEMRVEGKMERKPSPCGTSKRASVRPLTTIGG